MEGVDSQVWLGALAPKGTPAPILDKGGSESRLILATLLAAGAEWVGKTVTDKLLLNLTDANVHYGTPVNPTDA